MPYGKTPAAVERAAFTPGPEGADELAEAAAALFMHLGAVLSKHGRGRIAEPGLPIQRLLRPTRVTHQKRQRADAVAAATPARKRSTAVGAPSSTGTTWYPVTYLVTFSSMTSAEQCKLARADDAPVLRLTVSMPVI